VVPRRRFDTTGADVPVIGQGTWQMEHDDRAEAIRALRRGLDLGLSHIDTAETYGDGTVEGMVAEAIAGRRREVFLASKVLPSNASRSGTIVACESSLQRLRTDALDLYLLHWPGPHPLEDTLAAFEQLVREGKIRSFGVSNFDVSDLEEAVRIAGPGRIACNQVLYYLSERYAEAELLDVCARHGIALVAYSPFGSGRFPSARSHGGQVLAEIAATHGATPRQIALAFLTRHSNVFAIPKAARVEHVEANAAAAQLRLSAQELREIDEAFPPRKRSELPML
jgi:diketogulonate reductase-like aldo/keto reductase